MSKDVVFYIYIYLRGDAASLAISKQIQKFNSGSGKSFLRTKENRLFIQCFTIVGDEDGRNVEDKCSVGTLSDKHGGSSVPDSVATCFKRGSHATIWERGCIRLGLQEGGSSKRVDGCDLAQNEGGEVIR